MSRSWSSIVKGSAAAAVPVASVSAQAAETKVVFHPFCADCGEEADVCRHCDKLAVYQDGLCGHCFSYNMPSDSMCTGYVKASNEAEKIPFKCSACCSARPWNWEDDKEIVSYDYVPMSFSFPVSPTNVIRIARYRMKRADPSQRATEARAAYDKELSFSGNYAEALKIYTSFYKNMPKRKALKEGFVSLADILAGQPVSGKQFFDAIRVSS